MNTMTFPSKIDRWLAILVIGAMAIEAGIGLAIIIGQQRGWGVGLIMIGVALFIAWTFAQTFYVVQGPELLIRSGIFRWRIQLAEIEIIEPTRNPLSSPALSLDRLAIRFRRRGKLRKIMISPLDQANFLDAVAANSPGFVREGNSLKRSRSA